MSYYKTPIDEDQCVFLTYEGLTTAVEAASVRQKVNALLGTKRWNRVVVDVTQLQFVPTALELFEFSENPPSTSCRRVRIALVVRSDQARHGRFVEKVARNKGVVLTCFDAVENATAWIKPVNPAHDEDEPSTEYCEFQARGG